MRFFAIFPANRSRNQIALTDPTSANASLSFATPPLRATAVLHFTRRSPGRMPVMGAFQQRNRKMDDLLLHGFQDSIQPKSQEPENQPADSRMHRGYQRFCLRVDYDAFMSESVPASSYALDLMRKDES